MIAKVPAVLEAYPRRDSHNLPANPRAKLEIESLTSHTERSHPRRLRRELLLRCNSFLALTDVNKKEKREVGLWDSKFSRVNKTRKKFPSLFFFGH